MVYFSGALILYIIYILIVITQHFTENVKRVGILRSVHTIVRSDPRVGLSNDPNERLVEDFFVAINPIDMDAWSSSKIFGKISEILEVSIYVSTKLTISSI